MKKNIFKWFTLVELIIVITILAILTTVWFVSFQSYIKNTRDSNRVTTLKNLDTWLNLSYTKTQKYPNPDDYISILSSWSLIWYQWYAWDIVSWIILMNKTPVDSLDWKKITYSINSYQNAYQLLTFLENRENITLKSKSIIKQTYSSTLNARYPKIIWNDLWILLWATWSYLNTPIQELKSASFTWIDVKTYTWTLWWNNIWILKAVFSKESYTISWTWQKLSILDSSYRNKVSTLMSSCSNWWTQDWTINFDDGASWVNVWDFWNKVCEWNNDWKIPIWNSIVVANSSCPSGFDFKNGYLDDGTYHQSWGWDIKFNCDFFNSISGSDNYYSCLVCESKWFYIPSKTKLIMKECGIGYKYVSDFTFNDGAWAWVIFNYSNWNLKICEKL